ncbi:MAG: type II toxin-antitoxin system VapC family toxin [Chloroflexi bacterium]|nr:type II toxin-antitoxin system VapC family toxin [Chloroflexota bacterium]
MELLLDTHIFLWFISGDKRLPHSWRTIIQEPANDIYLSVVSLWEVIIKFQLGKLPLPSPPEVYLPQQRERHLISSLPLHEASVSYLAQLPNLHRDPFDRMMICQALHHNLTLVTVDAKIRAYSVKVLNTD